MVNEQSNANEVLAQVMVEAASTTIQAMAAAGAERIQNLGPRLDRPKIKQQTVKWEAEDKYNELKSFRLEENNIFKSYSTS